MARFQRLRAFLQWPVNLMIGVIVLSVIAWAVMRDLNIERDLDKEFAKSLLDGGVVGVAGALLSLLVSEADRVREDMRSRAALLTGTLNRITTSYNNSKRARRNARALGVLPGTAAERIGIKAYDECMADVNDAQLEFEAIEDEVREDLSTYPSGSEIADRLREMEQYLAGMVSEYERERRKVQPGQADIDLESIAVFSAFIASASAKESLFKEGYSRPHRKIRETMMHDILRLTSGELKPRKGPATAQRAKA